jgi:von Hippel-Lindau disease tumor supressor
MPSSVTPSISIVSMVNCDDSVTNSIYNQRNKLLALRLSTMFSNDTTCALNCSGHGDCYNGTCFCEVEYSGGACNDPNLRYYIAFSTVFYMICAVSFVQLILCINSEFSRQKPRSLIRALKITTQKALYFFICIATAIRGFYFSSPNNGTLLWAESLMSAYYPVLLSGSSLVVCFWAEVFHLHDVSVERPSFLSKSFTGFILFNVVTYSLLLAELVLLLFANPTDTDKSLFLSIFNSIYAILMLVVVIFFLIYGVEVYFKVRGAFIQEESWPADFSQLQQSRLGLISQAVLLLITVLFMFSEVLGCFWKDKVPVLSRNYHQIMFRVVELGVALWFPCVLWNCIRPERLWILNPRRILKKERSRALESNNLTQIREAEALVCSPTSSTTIIKSEQYLSTRSIPECWICYDSEKKDCGPLITPCSCKGDVSAVHHDCLKKWLMESYTNPENARCKVCNELYEVERGHVWLPSGLTITHWFKTAAIISIMCSAAAGTCLVVKIFEHMYVKTISVGCAILVEYICLRFLGFNMISAYHRAKFSAVKIIGQKITGGVNSNLMNMTTVSQTIPNHQLCTSCVNKRNSIDESCSDMTLNVRTDRQQKNSSKEYSAKVSEL